MSKEAEEKQQAIKETAIKYGDNRWWEADNDTMAYYQLREEVLMVNFGDFQRAVEDLIGLEPWSIVTLQFVYGLQELLDKSEKAYDVVKGVKRL